VRYLTGASALLLSFAAIDTGWSQTPGANATANSSTLSLEEIVVTAQRRADNLQDVPVSVTSVSVAQLKVSGVTSTEDLGMVTPGLTMPETSGALQPHIRGVGTSANGPGIESPVATYVDGVYYANATSSVLSLENIDRLEVLKGPQGTLFGRNTTGGLIQVITKDPQQDLSGIAQVGYANYQDTTASLYVTGGLTQTIAGDLSIYYERQGEGYGRNIFNGEDVDQLNYDYVVRDKFLFQPTDATQVRLTLDYEQRKSNYLTYHSIDAGTSGAVNSILLNTPAFGGPFNLGGQYGVNLDYQPTSIVKSGGSALNVKQDFDTVMFTSITGYRDASFRADLDVDFTPIDATNLALSQTDKQFSQEFQLASGQSSTVKWTTGFYYFYADDHYAPLGINLAGPSSAPLPNIDIDTNDGQQTHSYAAYAQASVPLFDKTNLTLGARYTYETKEFGGLESTSFPGTPIPTSVVPVVAGTYPDHIHEDKPSYRVSFDHKFTKDIMAYASFNSAFKSGGFNISVPSQQPYSPETLHAWELGTKTEWLDRRLRVNASTFYYDYTDIQIGYFVLGSEAFRNGAKAEVYGADLDLEAVVIEGFTVNGGVDYMHDRFTSFADAPLALPGIACTDTADAPLCEGSAAGHKLPYAPTTTFNVGANYGVALLGGNADINLAYFHSSGFFTSPDNTINQPSYELLNASIGWTDPSRRWTGRLFARNLTNQFYAISLVETPAGDARTTGAPRTYGATIAYRFGRPPNAP
jgi:iron complex outermembrane recepter protein